MEEKENIRQLFEAMQSGMPEAEQKLHEAIDKYLEQHHLERKYEVMEDFSVHPYDELEIADQEFLYEDELLTLTVEDVDEATLAKTYRVWIK